MSEEKGFEMQNNKMLKEKRFNSLKIFFKGVFLKCRNENVTYFAYDDVNFIKIVSTHRHV